MADFLTAYKKLAAWEGGYANHSADGGGETMRGIARKFHPNWPGWQTVDRIKREGGGREELNRNGQLLQMAGEFFRQRYWDKGGFGKIQDQAIAEIMFDWGVLTNPSRPWEYAEQLGAGTAAKINALSAGRRAKFFEGFKGMREAHHRRRVAEKPSQAVFLTGWLNRNESYTYRQTEGSSAWGGVAIVASFTISSLLIYHSYANRRSSY